MKKKEIARKLTVIGFFFLLFLIGGLFFMLPDKTLSKTERRKLAAAPDFTWKTIVNGSYMGDVEQYLTDQVVFRDGFRTLKAEAETKLFGKADTNGYFKVEETLYKLDSENREKNVVRAAQNFSAIAEIYFSDVEVYVSVIPDKNMFLGEEDGYPIPDENQVSQLIKENMKNAAYISIWDCLGKADYYRTDLHWRQECLLPVAGKIRNAMQKETSQSIQYQTILATDGFLGAYAGASALYVPKEQIYYLSNSVISQAVVYDYEDQTKKTVYAPEKIGQMDDYDFFLHGARALLTIKNQKKTDGKNLLIFRDSFAGSLAPLLLEDYANVTLVDLRYVSADYAMKLLSGEHYDDVLFLYSANMLGHSNSMLF